MMKTNTDQNKYRNGVCLLSGGMDSCVTAACAINECKEVIFLHVVYGQITAKRELKAFNDICDHYLIPESHRIIANLPCLNKFGGSTLLTSSDTPVETGKTSAEKNKAFAERDGASSESDIPPTYVPFRNGTLIALAAGLAEARNAGCIYIGAVEEDSSGYPDCRGAFFRAIQEAINQGTRPETKIEIKTPVITLDKKDIIILASKLSAPLHLSWSCYTSDERACGKCDSCKLRLAAFKRANMDDPILYAHSKENEV
jgi:7-cyano-7-deazaguanine synthase